MILTKESNERQEWYAVYTRVRHEKTASVELEKRQIDVFLPLVEKTSKWKDRKKKISVPLFPGYLFVHIEILNRMNVLKVPGVIKILAVNGRITPVPDYQIEGIKRLIKSGLGYEVSRHYDKGKKVEVIKGPLSGLKGEIIRTSGHYKLVLSVDIIKRSILLEIDYDQVELL